MYLPESHTRRIFEAQHRDTTACLFSVGICWRGGGHGDQSRTQVGGYSRTATNPRITLSQHILLAHVVARAANSDTLSMETWAPALGTVSVVVCTAVACSAFGRSAVGASRPTILLIRHGETDGNRTRTIQVPETPLSRKGVQQAQLLAMRLASFPLARLLTSDLARARMTAEAIAARATVKLELEPELAERNFGDWRGIKYDDLKQRGFDVMGGDTAPPNGETWAVFHARVARVWAHMAALAARERLPVALVSHGLTAMSILSRQVECPEAKGGGLNLGNTSVTVIVLGDDGIWRTSLTNCTSHLDDKASVLDLGRSALTGI